MSAKYVELLFEGLMTDDHPILLHLAMNWHEAMYGVPVGPPDPRREKPFVGLKNLVVSGVTNQ
jgi:hypothetical protein